MSRYVDGFTLGDTVYYKIGDSWRKGRIDAIIKGERGTPQALVLPDGVAENVAPWFRVRVAFRREYIALEANFLNNTGPGNAGGFRGQTS